MLNALTVVVVTISLAVFIKILTAMKGSVQVEIEEACKVLLNQGADVCSSNGYRLCNFSGKRFVVLHFNDDKDLKDETSHEKMEDAITDFVQKANLIP